MTPGIPFGRAARVDVRTLGCGTIARIMARASQFEARASVGGTPVEVSDVA